MKDSRLIELRLRAERDLSLSDGAFRLLCRLVSEKYNSPVFFAEDSFGLPWTMAHRLTGKARSQSKEVIKALVTSGYIGADGMKGCPPTAFFHFLLKRSEKRPLERSEKRPFKGSENRANHISIPSGKNSEEKGKNSSAPRARRNEGKELIERRRTPDEENGARVKSLAAAMRKAAS